MKQLEMEFVRNENNIKKLLEIGFKEEKNFVLNLVYIYGNNNITVFTDNSIGVNNLNENELCIILNLIDMGIFKVDQF